MLHCPYARSLCHDLVVVTPLLPGQLLLIEQYLDVGNGVRTCVDVLFNHKPFQCLHEHDESTVVQPPMIKYLHERPHHHGPVHSGLLPIRLGERGHGVVIVRLVCVGQVRSSTAAVVPQGTWEMVEE
jgi:hypothetical protein